MRILVWRVKIFALSLVLLNWLVISHYLSEGCFLLRLMIWIKIGVLHALFLWKSPAMRLLFTHYFGNCLRNAAGIKMKFRSWLHSCTFIYLKVLSIPYQRPLGLTIKRFVKLWSDTILANFSLPILTFKFSLIVWIIILGCILCYFIEVPISYH